MKKRVKIITKDLIVRTLRAKDVTSRYVSGMNDPAVTRYLVIERQLKLTHKSLRRYVVHNLSSKDNLLLGIFLRTTDALVGTIRISSISHFHHLCSLGICLFDKKYWGRGYALQALKAVIRFICTDLNLHYIEAGVYEDNISSVKLFQRAGFYKAAYFNCKYRRGTDFSPVILFGFINRLFKKDLLLKR